MCSIRVDRRPGSNQTTKPTVFIFTSDIDWAPEEAIADTLSLFAERGVRCTLFATHDSPEVHAADRSLFEIGLHPNFNGLMCGDGGSVDRILDQVHGWYPEARGVRSHSMTQSTVILNRFAQHGLLYDANHFLPYWSGIQPFRLWNGMIRIPYNWEDDIHWTYGHTFDSHRLDEASTLNVLDFHPVHVFLNTESQERYDAARPHYHDANRLLELRNTTSTPGTRDLLIRCLDAYRTAGSASMTMLDVAHEFSELNSTAQTTAAATSS